eukprot:gnl/MRDRNA2_/MRDRNA2_63536_c0_seq1.p1 gnl/MRDRNA2_/MRDRNA2_63536_c0~~gnl/MRDRNA2_/MRDRNA2_63536_c0_seq1.p1  ORF type:complete len:141 (+),score=18.31 gnl/MRDRNA2_/MRDRNA2_63536_c0_seq1:38-424(+)
MPSELRSRKLPALGQIIYHKTRSSKSLTSLSKKQKTFLETVKSDVASSGLSPYKALIFCATMMQHSPLCCTANSSPLVLRLLAPVLAKVIVLGISDPECLADNQSKNHFEERCATTWASNALGNLNYN